jgi:putative ABC transport system permease protein
VRLLSLCARSLLRRPLRSALTGFGLATGIAALVSLLALAGGLATSWSQVYRDRQVDLVVLNAQDADFLQSRVPETVLAAIRSLPQVEDADGALVDLTSYDGIANTFISGRTPGGFLLDRLDILEGRPISALPDSISGDEDPEPRRTGPPPARHAAEREILLGEAFAAGQLKGVGDSVLVEDEPFLVVGVYRASSLFENGGAVVHLKALQRFELREGELSSIEVRLRDPDQYEAVAAWIHQRFPQLQCHKPAEMVEQSVGLELAEAMAWVVSVLALAVGLVGASNTLLMSVLEQRRQFGILRALGWRTRRIFTLVLGETLLLSAFAYACGCALGAGATELLARVEATRNILDPRIDLTVLLQALAAALSLSVLAALYPAYRAARVSPMEAFRIPL